MKALTASKRLCRWNLVLTSATLLACGLNAKAWADGDGPANAASEAVWRETRRILDGIESTLYQHQTEIDEKNGTYRCDCSGLGIYILNRTVSKDDPRGPLGDGRTRPRAMNFYDAFVQAPAKDDGDGKWQRVDRVVDARPGDIIAWRRDVVLPGNSGHVVIVDQRPVVEKDGLVRVVMIDSTTRHLVDDTRKKGETGVGRGTMWFQVDADGRPVAYIRGDRSSEPVPMRISIGRAKPSEAAVESDQREAA